MVSLDGVCHFDCIYYYANESCPSHVCLRCDGANVLIRLKGILFGGRKKLSMLTVSPGRGLCRHCVGEI